MRRSRHILTLLAALVFWGGAAALAAPQRVVSMNLCTDQLAMLLAAPGQLYSVSDIALDPLSSPMAEQARGYAINHGLAEEIYMMQPDLVVAAEYTSPVAVDMLRRLGLPVIRFDMAESLDEVPLRLAEMGAVLGREAEAARQAEEFKARLAALRAEVARRPEAALFFANGYSLGPGTLSGDILRTAGFENIAAEFGAGFAGKLPLELLIMRQPELVVTGRPYPGGTRAEEIMAHPALLALAESRRVTTNDSGWVCGTPFTLAAVESLAAERRALEAAR